MDPKLRAYTYRKVQKMLTFSYLPVYTISDTHEALYYAYVLQPKKHFLRDGQSFPVLFLRVPCQSALSEYYCTSLCIRAHTVPSKFKEFVETDTKCTSCPPTHACPRRRSSNSGCTSKLRSHISNKVLSDAQRLGILTERVILDFSRDMINP